MPVAARLLLSLLLLTGTVAAQLAPQTVAEEAAVIDRLVRQAIENSGGTPLPVVDDQTFLRRAHLGLVGRIPDLEEQAAFEALPKKERRAALVRELVGSPGYVSHWFNFWADLFRLRSRMSQGISGEPFTHWLKDALTANKAYDQMVREVLTAEGAAHGRGNGATGFLLRDLGMPEDAMANATRVFLGTRLECAQCHDHPFDRWTQREFYELTAFAGGLEYRNDEVFGDAPRRTLLAVNRKVRDQYGPEGQRALQRALRTFVRGIGGSGTGIARLPDDYQYEDGKPGDPVVAKPLFGPAVDLDVKVPEEAPRRRARRNNRGVRPLGQPEVGSRQAFASWVTSKDNPRFTTVVVNRLWREVFGRGLIEPVDDMKDDTRSADAELLGHLEDLMVRLDYDLAAFVEILWNTEAAQREVLGERVGPEAAVLAGMPLRRLSAEQLWDSLLVLVEPRVDETLEPALSPRAEVVYSAFDRLAQGGAEALEEVAELAMLRTKDPAEARRRLREQMEAQAPQMSAEQRRALRDQLRTAMRSKDPAEVARAREAIREAMGQQLGARRRNASSLVRASDIVAPAPPDHFLRLLGQSDREVVDEGVTEPNVPQILTFMNGFVDSRIINNRSAVLRWTLEAADSPEAAIRQAFRAILVRDPTRSELATWKKAYREDPDEALGDLVWVLINSNAFRFAL